jgi:cardiolipin synthase
VKKLLKLLFSRAVFVSLLLLLQLGLLIFLMLRLSKHFYLFDIGMLLLSLVAVFYIISRPSNPTYKLAWVVPILAFPVLGGAFYLMTSFQRNVRRFCDRVDQSIAETVPYLQQEEALLQQLRQCAPQQANLVHYLNQYGGFPMHDHTSVKYLPLGEEKWKAMLEELEKAQHFIFMEYFIVEEGVMWDSILEILQRKAAQGVDVRVMYDGMGCLTLLPFDYPKKLRSMGIQCRVFNPFVPFLSVVQNNRDHRKILVIDGHTGFTGGINLADEYINHKKVHGHWKDTALLLHGEGVQNLTMLFLQMWNIHSKEQEDYTQYLPHTWHPEPFPESPGYVLPYGDSPMDRESVGETVYLETIAKAQRYVHVTSPYLILDNEMVTAFSTAAKSGVDVKIIVPHIPDHWYVYAQAQSYYSELLAAGVQVFEYTPGFIHAKMFVSDDQTAVVGTINLDYRSLYLHFECAAWMFDCPAVADIEADFQRTLAQCQRVTPDDCRRIPWPKKMLNTFLRLFAPLM